MKENDARMALLKEEKVENALLKLGLPTMAGMLLSALYNAIDAYFVGGLGTSQMGAVSVVFPIVQLIIGLGMMFGAGASSYISRLLGKEDYEMANRVASTALLSGLMVGGIIILGILLQMDAVLTALGATKTILPYARAYARIYVAGSIINVFTVTMNNLLTAQGATRYTMLSMMSGSIANVILDPILIYGLKMEIEGAAIATVLSLCISLGMYIWYLARQKGVLKISIRKFTISGEIYGEILKIGVPVLAFQFFTSAALGLINSKAKIYGDYAVAAMGAVSRILTIGTYVVFGFMKGFQPFAGYNYGAGQYARLKKAISLCLLWSTVFCVGAAVLFLFLAEPVIGLFGTDLEMISLGSKALRINSVFFITFGLQMVYASLYLSAGKSLEGSVLSLGRQGIFFFPLMAVLPSVFGLAGILWVQPLADALSAIMAFIFALRTNQRLGISSEELRKVNV